MVAQLLLFTAGVFLVGAAGALVLARPGPWTDRPVARHLLAARQALVAELGAPFAAVGVLLAGLAATAIVCWPLGRLAGRSEKAIDVPVFDWATRHAHHRAWTDVNKVLTLMGNRFEVKLVCLVSALVLAVLWRRRGWWIPPVAIAAAFVIEKYGQKMLALVAHRGHPVTGAGTYPSGGCARLISIYGTILFLGMLTYPQISRRVRVVLWTLLAVAAFVEGYTRFYLLKHWLTDIIGGWIFGTLLLFTFVAAISTLVARVGSGSAAPPNSRPAREHRSPEAAAVG